MLWEPKLRFETVHAAVLPVRETDEQLVIVFAPSLNWTLPSLFGSPAKDVTVAVNVCEAP